MKVNEEDARRLVETATAFRKADRELNADELWERSAESGRPYGEIAQAVAGRYLEARTAHQEAIAKAEGS